jgi:predicted dehydrogenase
LNQLRIAIIGAGLMGRWHAQYAQRGGAKVVAVVDQDLVAAQTLAGQCGAKSIEASDNPNTDDWSDKLACDVVHICTGADSHPKMVRTAIEAGLHVQVEKPLTHDLQELRQLIDLAQAQQRRLCAVHQMPCQRGIQRLRQNLSALGSIVRVGYYADTAGGDALDDPGKQDLLLELLAHPVSLFDALGFETGPADNWQIVCATQENVELTTEVGATRLHINISLNARPTRNELKISGTNGSAMADLYHGFSSIDRAAISKASKILRPFRLACRQFTHGAINLAGRAFRREPAFPGLPQLIEQFYECIHHADAQPPVSDQQMLAVGALMHSVRQSFPANASLPKQDNRDL